MAQKQGASGGTYEFSIKDFIKSFLGVVKTVVITPKEFYQNMPTTGGYAAPVIFLAICLLITAILTALFSWSFAKFFSYIIFYIIFSFIVAGVLHFIAQQFFEGKGAYEGIYRVVAYASVVQLVGWLPSVHGIFIIVTFCAWIYGLYLQIVGIEKVHQIAVGQAVVTVLIALAVFFIISLLVSLVVSVPFLGVSL
jgi:hypothetical protein